MILSSIHASLIIKVILLLAIHHVVLGLRLRAAITNIFGIHALHCAGFARLRGWRGVLVTIGGAGAQS